MPQFNLRTDEEFPTFIGSRWRGPAIQSVKKTRIFRGGPWDGRIELDNNEVPWPDYKERRVTWHNNGLEKRREFVYRRPNYGNEEVSGQSAAAQTSDT